MEKRIAALSSNPHTVSLTDRKSSLFIDPKSGSIFVDEGDGGPGTQGTPAVVAAEPAPAGRGASASDQPDGQVALVTHGMPSAALRHPSILSIVVGGSEPTFR